LTRTAEKFTQAPKEATRFVRFDKLAELSAVDLIAILDLGSNPVAEIKTVTFRAKTFQVEHSEDYADGIVVLMLKGA